MSCWFCIPSARPPEEANKVLKLWRQQGYRIALWRDGEDESSVQDLDSSLFLRGTYPGYALAVNALVKAVMNYDAEAEWLVTGGDDTEPDLNYDAGQIAFQCGRHFGEAQQRYRMEYVVSSMPLPPQPSARNHWSTFGVMQPTGDRYAGGSIDRICGSPWMGREFCERIYGGKGPLWPEFTHMFVDEHLQCVAQKLGILWQRPDLIHLHHHFMRVSTDLNSDAIRKEIPAHLAAANSPTHWINSQRIFERLKAKNFEEADNLLPAKELAVR